MAEAQTSYAVCECHSFSDVEELEQFRSNLLSWYEAHKRDLPWRTLATSEKDPNKRAYGVWVSEVMLQQTQVATVVEYYNRWMKKWPTVDALATATLEEVRTMWSGLGYYSRGQRLWEGAKKVVEELEGVIPNTAEKLVKTLPGVGQYTAGAIASIAFGQATGVVDGNVMRVLSRHRLIGAEITKQKVIQHFWDLANKSVDHRHPGEFNQALMELGATVCMPKSPQCHSCPLRSSCMAFRKVNEEQHKGGLHRYSKLSDEGSISLQEDKESTSGKTREEHCPLCLADGGFDLAMGVTNYPRKSQKKRPPTEHYAVAVVESRDGQLLLRQRPQTGLLAGLWEFPAVSLDGSESSERMWDKIQTVLIGKTGIEHSHIGHVVHHFSHIHYHCHCWHLMVTKGKPLLIEHPQTTNWIDKSTLTQQPISTLVRKIFQLLKGPSVEQQTAASNRKLRAHRGSVKEEKNTKRQKTINQYFK